MKKPFKLPIALDNPDARISPEGITGFFTIVAEDSGFTYADGVYAWLQKRIKDYYARDRVLTAGQAKSFFEAMVDGQLTRVGEDNPSA